MATQKVYRFCHSCGELYDENDRFCLKWGYKRRSTLRSSHPEVFLGKAILKICSKFTGKHPCRRVISIKLLCNSIEITLRHGFSPVNLLHIFRTSLYKNTSGGLFICQTYLNIVHKTLITYKFILGKTFVDWV